MMKPVRVSESFFDGAPAAACLTAMLVLTATVGRASAQQPASAPTHTAQARMRNPVPTSIPHTQPASRPQRGTASKPTVVLQPGEVPAISFEESTWEFGRVKSGEDLTHEFVFTNTGTGPLEILEVKPG